MEPLAKPEAIPGALPPHPAAHGNAESNRGDVQSMAGRQGEHAAVTMRQKADLQGGNLPQCGS